MSIIWVLKKFDELPVHELYAILHLRNEVFVVEQNCVYQDTDNKDQLCYHFMGWQNDKLIACTRIVPPSLANAMPSIGRVVTSPSARGGGLGRELMIKSIEQVRNIFGNVPIKIGAQVYLLKFYSSLGFQQKGEIYLEDNIEHVDMILPKL